MPCPADDYSWGVGELPFFFKFNDTSALPADGLPLALPMNLMEDERTGLIKQRPDKVIEKNLEKAYRVGSILSGVMDCTGIGKDYADDFMQFIESACVCDMQGKNVLEIGCGLGYLLSCFKMHGANVLGIEPGSQGKEGAKRFDIPIVEDFFPTPVVAGEFDLIIAYGVLEHIQNITPFLDAVKKHLCPGGYFVAGVPNCSPYLLTGDISCLMHEHWNYFTKNTLVRTLFENGMSVDYCVEGMNGGILYVLCKVVLKETLAGYRDRYAVGVRRLNAIIEHLRSLGFSLGICAAPRLINMIFANGLHKKIPLRLFDDNPALWGKYAPGCPLPFECFDPSDPTLARIGIVIASKTFGEQIFQKVSKVIDERLIWSWDDLFEV